MILSTFIPTCANAYEKAYTSFVELEVSFQVEKQIFYLYDFHSVDSAKLAIQIDKLEGELKPFKKAEKINKAEAATEAAAIIEEWEKLALDWKYDLRLLTKAYKGTFNQYVSMRGSKGADYVKKCVIEHLTYYCHQFRQCVEVYA